MKPISYNGISQKLTEFDVIHLDLLESVDLMKCQLYACNGVNNSEVHNVVCISVFTMLRHTSLAQTQQVKVK